MIRKSELARLLGVTPAAVTFAIKGGRIADAVRVVNGRELLDHDLALQLWKRNTLANNNAVQVPVPGERKARSKRTEPAAAPAEARRPAAAAEPDVANAPTAEQLRAFIEGMPEDQIPELNESRARREHYQAEKARLEALQGRGELVPAADVKRQAFETARATRDALLGIPDRLAAQLAACSDARQVHVLLSEELRVALRGLANG
mgnify:CR=1 FL=1